MNIDSIVDKDFKGCISVIKNKKHIFQKAYGFASRQYHVLNNVNTIFGTASAGKIFVATAILQLIEEGNLTFDTTIGELLDFDLKAIEKSVSIKQLLNHTSGIPDYFDESIMDDYEELWRDYPNYKIRSSSDLIPLFIDKPMSYTPGEKFQYNNTGYVMLGLIIEKITKMPFDVYLNKKIFQPIGMLNTGYYELDRLPDNCATAYIYDEEHEEYYSNIYSIDVKGSGAGGAFTTVSDIEIFWSNLLNGKLISKDMLESMFSVQSHGNNEYYGYGVWLHQFSTATYMPYIEGCDPGISFISSYNKIYDLNITIISNYGCNVWKLRRDIYSYLVEGILNKK